MKIAFIAGPYRDPRGAWWIGQNIAAARDVAAVLWRMGYAVLCPHLNSAYMDGAATDEVFLAGYRALLARCDVVVALPGWERSEGAQSELAEAATLGKPVRYWPADRAVIAGEGREVCSAGEET